MKLKVVGWTNYDDMHFEEGKNSFASHEAIIRDIKAHGYDFTGWHHEEAENGAPVLNNGKIYRYSQRGWGAVMADAYGERDPHAYSLYAFSFGEHGDNVKMPKSERNIVNMIFNAAKEVLDEEDYNFLFEEDYTTRCPHPELGDKGIYTLTPDEAEEVSCFDTVRQVPPCVMRRFFSDSLHESFTLDEYEFQLNPGKITLKMQKELEYIEAGDSVTIEDKSYIVKDVNQYKDVPEDIRISLMYKSSEGYEEALNTFENAELLIDIFI